MKSMVLFFYLCSRCWIYIPNNPCLTIGLRLGLLYGPVVLVFGCLLYMLFHVKGYENSFIC